MIVEHINRIDKSINDLPLAVLSANIDLAVVGKSHFVFDLRIDRKLYFLFDDCRFDTPFLFFDFVKENNKPERFTDW